MEKIIHFQDKKYPKLLKKIKPAPQKLYYRGSWDSEIFENCLAAVGSRRMTGYGKKAAEQIITELAASGLTIVSGFMYGIDAVCHRACLQGGGRTIAVMPCGIDIIHPEGQEDLYQEIINNKGLIISEYEKGFLPALWTYPKRNRIVAGLAKAVLVIEAGLQSGSLITANLAREFGRKVFAVPGPINSENSKGTLQLLKEGAELVTSAKDILDFYKIKSANSRKEKITKETDRIEEKVISQLKRESLSIDELARDLGIPASELGVTLSLMQLRGLISQEGRKYYVD